MSAPISSWVAHANREPSELLLDVMDSWLTRGSFSEGDVDSCPWLSSELHRLILVHVDRAAHKRRHMPTFVSTRPCTLESHGQGPMSMIVKDDAYGTQPLSVVHSEPETALEHAINLVKERDYALAVAVVSESEFEDPDRFDLHRGALLSPSRDGVVLAVIHAPLHAKENLDDEIAREDLLRAAGYATYTVDLSREEDSRHLHKRMASLLEDIFDEITQIKADAAARILSSNPLWPALVVRTSPEWRTKHSEPLITGEIPVATGR